MSSTRMILALALAGSLTVAISAVIHMMGRLLRLINIGTKIYCAGYWKAEGVSAQAAEEMWTELRDAVGIKPGTWTMIAKLDTRK